MLLPETSTVSSLKRGSIATATLSFLCIKK
jgi:hypothetical protein